MRRKGRLGTHQHVTFERMFPDNVDLVVGDHVIVLDVLRQLGPGHDLPGLVGSAWCSITLGSSNIGRDVVLTFLQRTPDLSWISNGQVSSLLLPLGSTLSVRLVPSHPVLPSL